MNNIFSDIKTAIKLTGEVHKARREGAAGLEIRRMRRIPVIDTPCWGWTMEGSLFYEAKWQPIREVFGGFPEEQQRALTFTPEQPGEWVERARLWQHELRPALPDALYHEAMLKITHHYARCKRMRAEAQS